jgi:hypothetical protein
VEKTGKLWIFDEGGFFINKRLRLPLEVNVLSQCFSPSKISIHTKYPHTYPHVYKSYRSKRPLK